MGDPVDAQEPRKRRLRIFYEGLVKSMGLDPRVPDTWYNLPRSAVLESKVSHPLLVFFLNMYFYFGFLLFISLSFLKIY